MAESPTTFAEAVSQVSQFARATSPRQRLLLAGGALAVIVLLVVFVRMINNPEMKTLASALKPSDAQAIAARLAARNIAYELSPDGSSIQVPSDKLDEGRLELASQPLTSGTRLGFELFDKTNWVASDFDEKVNYQRAMEGELERTLQTLNGVEAVRVHLALPPDSVFTDQDRRAKASVVLKLRGRTFTRELQGTISRLVASSVDKLDPQQVSVVDGDTGQMLSLATNDPSSPSAEPLEQVLQTRLLQTLEPIVGADCVRASVRVEYDLSATEETQESYDPNGQVALTTHKTEEQGSAIAGIPGASSNVTATATKPSQVSIPAGPQSRSENNTYAVSRSIRHSTQPAGTLKRITAALVIDDAISIKQESGKSTPERIKRTPEQLQQIQEVAKAAIGIDGSRGDVLTVANISFEQKPVEVPPAGTLLEKSRRVVNDWSWIVRLATIAVLFLVVYFAVLRPIKKQLIASFKSTLHSSASTQQSISAQDSDGLTLPTEANEDSKRLGHLRKQLVAKVTADPAVSTRLVQNWIGDLE